MSNTGEPSAALRQPNESPPAERIVARVRRHARALFWPSLLLVVACALTGYFAGKLPEPWMRITLWSGLAAVVLFGWLLPLLWWLGQRATISTRRVIVRSGFLVRTRQEVPFSRVYDVSLRRGPLQAVFRSGDVLLNTGADRPVLLRDVPRAALVQRAIHELVDASHGAGSLVHWQDSPSALTDKTVVWGGR